MIEKIRIALSRVFVLALLMIILLSSSATNQRWPLFAETLFFMGVVLAAVASMGRLWCSVYIAGYKTDVLVMQGPYSMTRNPLYFFSLIGAMGVALATETLIIPILVLFAFAAYYPFVIKSEESVLLKRHGNAFSNYFKTVPRFFPKMSGFMEPDTYVVRPKVIKRHMLDALWFVWLLGFLELIEVLHELEMLPTLLWVY
ncbi:methyltransferase family protein [Desulfosarcina variabilis]|uniref:methyltransferase family protein n=1 Tax=Desulfosarcina variabilis TaxID=2300 RepID=UPI003AFA7FD4